MVYLPVFLWCPELGNAGSYTLGFVLPRSGFVQQAAVQGNFPTPGAIGSMEASLVVTPKFVTLFRSAKVAHGSLAVSAHVDCSTLRVNVLGRIHLLAGRSDHPHPIYFLLISSFCSGSI
jgi:hypothetical protein